MSGLISHQRDDHRKTTEPSASHQSFKIPIAIATNCLRYNWNTLIKIIIMLMGRILAWRRNKILLFPANHHVLTARLYNNRDNREMTTRKDIIEWIDLDGRPEMMSVIASRDTDRQTQAHTEHSEWVSDGQRSPRLKSVDMDARNSTVNEWVIQNGWVIQTCCV